MKARATDLISIDLSYILEGIAWLEVLCSDTTFYLKLSKVVEYNNKLYYKTGWNSDLNRAYYKSTTLVARPIL